MFSPPVYSGTRAHVQTGWRVYERYITAHWRGKVWRATVSWTAAHKAQRSGGGWRRLHHIKEQIVYCSHSASFETCVTFFPVFCVELWACLPRLSTTVTSRGAVAAERQSLLAASGCEYFRNPIFKVKNSVRIPFLYAWNESLEAKAHQRNPSCSVKGPGFTSLCPQGDKVTCCVYLRKWQIYAPSCERYA